MLLIAVPLDLLQGTPSTVALWSAALGVGGLAAGLAGSVVHHRRLGRLMAAGMLLWGLTLLVLAGAPSLAAGATCMVVIGLGNSLVDAAGYTLIVRTVRDDVLARVYGVHEAMRAAAISAGSLLTAAVIATSGVSRALAVVGGIVVAAPILAAPHLVELDRRAVVPAARLALLRGSSVFAPLLPVSLERLAARMTDVPEGRDLVVEGAQGDAGYIKDGYAVVLAGGRRVAELGPGDHFGEIAMVFDVPRTATVRSTTAMRVYAIEREEFLAGVGGHPLSAAAVTEGAGARLRELGALGHPAESPVTEASG